MRFNREQFQDAADVGLPIEVPEPLQRLGEVRGRKNGLGQSAELLLDLGVGHRIAGVTAREGDLFGKARPGSRLHGDAVGDSLGIARTQFVVTNHFDLGDQIEQGLVGKPFLVELLQPDLSVGQRTAASNDSMVMEAISETGPISERICRAASMALCE